MVDLKEKKVILLEVAKIEKIMQNYRRELDDHIEIFVKNLTFKNTLEKIKIQQLRIQLQRFLEYYYKQQKKWTEIVKNLYKFWDDPNYYEFNIDFYNCLSCDLEIARAYVRQVHEILAKNDLKYDLHWLRKYEKVLCDTAKTDLPRKEVKE